MATFPTPVQGDFYEIKIGVTGNDRTFLIRQKDVYYGDAREFDVWSGVSGTGEARLEVIGQFIAAVINTASTPTEDFELLEIKADVLKTDAVLYP